MTLRHTSIVVVSVVVTTFSFAPVRAGTTVPYTGVGQHGTVMNNIARAQRRNNAAIRHVQSNIRASRPKTY